VIEKAFAIDAKPEEVWAALWRDLSAGDKSLFAIEHSNWPSLLTIQVRLAGLPVRLTYRIESREGQSEVSAALEPLSARYWLYQGVTLGHFRRNYEVLLVQGLANLKQSLENDAGPGSEAPVPIARTGGRTDA
jgi:hypothetical protein